MTDTSLRSILLLEFRLHPTMNEQDLYKLLSQAVFGGDHLLRDTELFRMELTREWESIPAHTPADTPLIQLIDPAGRTARVHLAPFRKAGGGLVELSAFLAGQDLKCGSDECFRILWQSIPDVIRQLGTHLDPGILASIAPGNSPVHHSPGYGFASYRICNDIRSPRSASWLESAGISAI